MNNNAQCCPSRRSKLSAPAWNHVSCSWRWYEVVQACTRVSWHSGFSSTSSSSTEAFLCWLFIWTCFFIFISVATIWSNCLHFLFADCWTPLPGSKYFPWWWYDLCLLPLGSPGSCRLDGHIVGSFVSKESKVEWLNDSRTLSAMHFQWELQNMECLIGLLADMGIHELENIASWGKELPWHLRSF